ncbi:MAG: DMT family transporter [Pseudomonadota bacterium]|nr:DMT family transporter [Pseudomonadota bacterium]
MSQLSTNLKMTPLTWGYLVALSIVWGGTFFFQEIAVAELPTLVIVGCRVVLAAVILIFVMLLFRIPFPRGTGVWRAFVTLAVINNIIPFSLIVWGQIYITSSLASILNATTPLFGVVAAHFMTADEKMSPLKVLGLILGFIGVVIMIGGEVLLQIGSDIPGQLAVVAAAAAYAFGGIYGRRFKAMGVAPTATATCQLTVSAIILVPVVLLVHQPWTLAAPGTDVVLSLIALASVSTALAYFFYFRILSAAGATNLMLVTFLIPVTGIALGILFLNEVLELPHVIGFAFIAAGLAAIDGRIFGKIPV